MRHALMRDRSCVSGSLLLAYLPENPMATTSKKAKAKRRPSAKAKSKSKSAAPLLALAATVRKAHPAANAARAAAPTPAAFNPAIATFQFMARATAACAELPSRLARCRSPMDLWLEQVRFAQQIFEGPAADASSPPRPASRRR
jgi:hypothetical protein